MQLELVKEVVDRLSAFWNARSKSREEAIKALLSAIAKTRSYLADQREGRVVRDWTREQDLQGAWGEAAYRLDLLDRRLGANALAKSIYWSDPNRENYLDDRDFSLMSMERDLLLIQEGKRSGRYSDPEELPDVNHESLSE